MRSKIDRPSVQKLMRRQERARYLLVIALAALLAACLVVAGYAGGF